LILVGWVDVCYPTLLNLMIKAVVGLRCCLTQPTFLTGW